MRRVTWSAIAVLLISTSVWAGDAPKATSSGQELRVGIATNYPPFAFKQGGHLTGIEPQFAKNLGHALGAKIQIVETPWDELIPALRDHRIDVIMSGMSITEARKQQVSFTDPYLRVGQMGLIRKTDDQRIPRLDAKSVTGKRVGVVGDTTGDQYARANLSTATIKAFDSVDSGVAALRKGEIDVFVHDAPAIWRVTGGFDSPERQLIGRFKPLTEEYLAWAVRQDDEALRTQLNTVLGRWKANGQLNAVLDHWIRVRKMEISTKPVH